MKHSIKKTNAIISLKSKWKALLFSTIFILHGYCEAAIVKDNSAWPNSTIPIEIDRHFTVEETNTIIGALNEMMQKTNVVFKLHPLGTPGNFIKYTKNDLINYLFDIGGNAPVGLLGIGGQEINFKEVTRRVVIHETMHSLGFYHEQSREDRDRFIKILWENMNPIYIGNFAPQNFDATDIGRYDIRSIMHYRFNAFGLEEDGVPKKTIVNVLDTADISFGLSDTMSVRDIAAINQIYSFRPRTRTPIPELKFMEVGERKTVRIEANKEYNFFGIIVQSGQQYRFTAFRRDRWKGSRGDTRISADGIRRRGCRRINNYRSMKMVGSIFTEEHQNSYTGHSINIGLNLDVYTIPDVTGFLNFFANDCLGFYGDNIGSIGLHIDRIR